MAVDLLIYTRDEKQHRDIGLWEAGSCVGALALLSCLLGSAGLLVATRHGPLALMLSRTGAGRHSLGRGIAQA